MVLLQLVCSLAGRELQPRGGWGLGVGATQIAPKRLPRKPDILALLDLPKRQQGDGYAYIPSPSAKKVLNKASLTQALSEQVAGYSRNGFSQTKDIANVCQKDATKEVPLQGKWSSRSPL